MPQSAYPAPFQWVPALPVRPRMIDEWSKILGTAELAGPASNPAIMKWAEEVGEEAIGFRYAGDHVPWCGLAMAVVAKRAGKALPPGPLRALNWRQFGRPLTPVEVPSLGDVVIYARENGGHVNCYVAEGFDRQGRRVIWGIGGNQSDRVGIDPLLTDRVVDVRRPIYRVQPESVLPFTVSTTGTLSTDEK